MKLTPKQEKFALHYHEHGNGREAFKHAGYKVPKDENSFDSRVHELKNNRKVSARLVELKEESQNKVQYGVEEAYKELCEAMVFAQKQDNPNAVISAIKTKMVLLGLEAPKKTQTDVTTKGESINQPINITTVPLSFGEDEDD